MKELIERLKNQRDRDAAEHCPAEIIALQDETIAAIESLQSDAERYRFIKKYSRGDLYNNGVDFDWYAPNDDLDQQIDFAIDQQDPISQLIETSQNLGLYDK